MLRCPEVTRFLRVPQGQDEIRTADEGEGVAGDGAEGDQGRIHLCVKLGVYGAGGGGAGARIGTGLGRSANRRGGDGDAEIE